MDGWIKLHRKTLDNPIVCKDSDHIAVWMYLLLNATHKQYPAMFMGNKILLQPGQLITGRKVIAEKFNISESKVQRILKSFENEQQIEQQNGNKNRLISILSWPDYQESEQQDEHLVNNKRTTTEQQVNTNKNVKNDKNERIREEFNPYRLLEENKFPFITPLNKDMIDDLLIEYGASEFLESVKICTARGKRNFSYLKVVLQNRRSDGEHPTPKDRLAFINDL